MITIAAQRAAYRTQTVNYIAAWPSSARFLRRGPPAVSTLTTVRTSEPAKSREMKSAGFTPGIALECQIALPFGLPNPEPTLDRIEILDLSGQYLAYDIVSVTPLRGTSCYRFGLAPRNSKPTSATPPAPAG